jgi:hypothetical protein
LFRTPDAAAARLGLIDGDRVIGMVAATTLSRARCSPAAR